MLHYTVFNMLVYYNVFGVWYCNILLSYFVFSFNKHKNNLPSLGLAYYNILSFSHFDSPYQVQLNVAVTSIQHDTVNTLILAKIGVLRDWYT